MELIESLELSIGFLEDNEQEMDDKIELVRRVIPGVSSS